MIKLILIFLLPLAVHTQILVAETTKEKFYIFPETVEKFETTVFVSGLIETPTIRILHNIMARCDDGTYMVLSEQKTTKLSATYSVYKQPKKIQIIKNSAMDTVLSLVCALPNNGEVIHYPDGLIK